MKVKAPPQGTDPGGFHGTDVHAGMKYFLDAIWGWKAAVALPVAVSLDPGDFHGGSPNMKQIYSSLLYGASLLGAPENTGSTATHRQRVNRILARELDCHQQGESLTTSHDEVWVGPIATDLYLAEKFGHQEILALTVYWFQVHHAIHKVCRLTSGKIGKLSLADMRWGGGSRSITKDNQPIGFHEVSAKTWTAIETGRVAGRVNQTDIGAWMLTRVSAPSRERIKQWPASFPPLALEFHARRYEGDDFVMWFEGERPKGWAMSAGVENGERWMTVERDGERVKKYSKRSDPPILSIDAPKGEPR